MLPLILFCTAYLTLIFPFAYFRHDDWWALGNAMRLEQSPGLLWSVNLVSGDREVVWFFRPLFRLIYYVVYQVFGMNYYLWLTAMLACTVAACYFGSRLVTLLTHSPARARFFLILFCANVTLHLGSLAWAGEGLMNCPQLLLLVATTYFFCRTLLEGAAKRSLAWAVICFVLALGFKESSVFQCGFLLALAIVHPEIAELPRRKKLAALLPFVVISTTFLIYRLFFLPLNPEYAPHWQIGLIVPTLLRLAGPLLLPWFALAALGRKSDAPPVRTVAFQLIGYGLFFLLCLAPYFGHAFFSPGWLLYPGFFSVLVLCLLPWPADLKTQRAVGALVFAVSVTVSAWQMNKIGWWQWKKGQREFSQIVASLPPETQTLNVIDCPNPAYPASTLTRVIGFPEGLLFIRPILGKSPVRIWLAPCRTPWSSLGGPIVEWNFPNFTWLRKDPANKSASELPQTK